MAERSGFTLIELLVALAVFALAALALLNLGGENTRSAARAETRTLGVMSKSAPAPSRKVPGLLKLDCPSSFDERSELSTPLRPESPITRPPPAKGIDWRIQ